MVDIQPDAKTHISFKFAKVPITSGIEPVIEQFLSTLNTHFKKGCNQPANLTRKIHAKRTI